MKEEQLSSVRSLQTYIDNLMFSDAIYKNTIMVEHRSNNPNRDFLFVNNKLCKHIPTSPIKFMEMCEDLAKTININKDSVLVIGFAETATALGTFIAEGLSCNADYACTTREKLNSIPLIEFYEEHSHAPQHLFYLDGGVERLKQYKYILFIDDEITTGKTILNFVNEIKKIHSDVSFGVASVCNWQNQINIKKFEDNGIKRFYLISGQIKDETKKMDISEENICLTKKYTGNGKVNEKPVSYILSGSNHENFIKNRTGGIPHYDKILDVWRTSLVKKINNAQTIRIIGTEEFMAFPIMLGMSIEANGKMVFCHATTRSNIDTLSIIKYPKHEINEGHEVISAYDSERTTYLYNYTEPTDLTLIVSDTPNSPQFVQCVDSIVSLLDTKETIAIQV